MINLCRLLSYCHTCVALLLQSFFTYTGTALIVEWLNVKIQNRHAAGSSPTSNGNSQVSNSLSDQETYQFQVRITLINLLDIVQIIYSPPN